MPKSILSTKDLTISIKATPLLEGINLDIHWRKITAIIGPSGCGKTTLIRTFNRLTDFDPDISYTGKITLFDHDIAPMHPILLRRKVGMVFQRPMPFPTMSILDDVVAGYTLNNIPLTQSEKEAKAHDALQKVGLWDEVKDRLSDKGRVLSGGQQQRLCIARTLALGPKLLLLDEPTSSLDHKSTQKIEDLLTELKKTITIIIVTHNIAQAERLSDMTALISQKRLVEWGPTTHLFTTPNTPETAQYLSSK